MAAALELMLPHVQVGSAMACTVEQARAAAAEADRAAQMARVFEVRCCTVNSKIMLMIIIPSACRVSSLVVGKLVFSVPGCLSLQPVLLQPCC